tara:strand:+ start:489 stop:1028 length:540 start_codon:yes stop_codon:yes gene_type:complete
MTAYQIEFHPAVKKWVAGFLFIVVIVSATALISYFKGRSHASAVKEESQSSIELSTGKEWLLPVIYLDVQDDASELEWSRALATVLSGVPEKSTEFGRVDVFTNKYAIEVERLAKWHEGIGQAAHYASTTKALPVLALMITSKDSESSDSSRVDLIEKVCVERNIKLIILKSKMSPTRQ